jgi:hypothetical protein
MTNQPPDDRDEELRAFLAAYDLAADLAKRCNQLREMYRPSNNDALRDVISTLMTELWDQRFSQTEIRDAFTTALDDMPRYAAGQERR